MKYDVVIIGSGMSGLVAAARAVTRGKSTIIITKGQGMLPLTTGCIDFWGYQLDNPKIPALNPYQEIQKLVALNLNTLMPKSEMSWQRVWNFLKRSFNLQVMR
jgi:glycerol-3-phosphate dehydrogenase subunit B